MDWLQTIVADKRAEVASRKRAGPPAVLATAAEPAAHRFSAGLKQAGASVIAEIKRRSPSRGPLRPDLDPVGVARAYERHGAAAISVVTDRKYFGGSVEDLLAVRGGVSLPVLRKDFIIDAFQIRESKAIGADAILLIARVLTDSQLSEYLGLAHELELDALVEVHDEAEIERALRARADIVGVNNRDLDTFEVSLQTALRLAERVPKDCVRVAESGIRCRAEVVQLEQAGYDAVLVGESLMQAEDPGAKLGELLEAAP